MDIKKKFRSQNLRNLKKIFNLAFNKILSIHTAQLKFMIYYFNIKIFLQNVCYIVSTYTIDGTKELDYDLAKYLTSVTAFNP